MSGVVCSHLDEIAVRELQLTEIAQFMEAV